MRAIWYFLRDNPEYKIRVRYNKKLDAIVFRISKSWARSQIAIDPEDIYIEGFDTILTKLLNKEKDAIEEMLTQ